MPADPSVDECRDWLRRAGWSAEEWATSPGGRPRYRVVARKGGREVVGEGDSPAAAWWQACGRALGVPRAGG